MQFWALIASVAFLSALTAVGIWHAKRVKTGEDFALAGRRLPLVVVVGTLVATWIGTGSIFGNGEFAYEHGWIAILQPLSGVVGILCLVLLAGRARELPADSVPQILGLRFGRPAQLLGALALIGAYLVIVSYQFRAGANLVKYMLPSATEQIRDVAVSIAPPLAGLSDGFWEKAPAIVGFGLFVILYTVLAGMVSVAWTDLLNGLLMSVGILISFAILALQALNAEPDSLPIVTELAKPAEALTPIRWSGTLLPVFLLVLGDANLYQRFMSARSPSDARRAAFCMFFGVLVMEGAIIGIACLGRQLLPTEPEVHGNTVLQVAFTLLPAWLGVLLCMSIAAVIITTADSYLLGCATSVSADLTSGLSTAARQRIIALILGLIAMGLSFTSEGFFRIAIYAYTLYGATLTPAVVAALVRPQTAGTAVVAGMSGGLAVALLWKALLAAELLPDSIAEFDPVLPALGTNILLLLLFSILLEPRQPTTDLMR